MATNNPADIAGMVENIKTTGLAYSNRYEVIFNTPAGFNKTDLFMLRSLSLRCDSVSVPGRSFSTTPYRFYGPARNMPYEPIYSGEMSLSIILSEDLRERTFFEMWMEKICDRTNYKFGFYDDYVTNLLITPLTKFDGIAYEFVIEEAYPKAIGDLQMGYDKDNDFLRQDITMAFRKYTANYIGLQSPPQPPIANQSNFINQFASRNGKIDPAGLNGSRDGYFSPETQNAVRSGIKVT